ncbi:DUF5131 family protein [Methylocystis sp. SC2]|uniref:DUF5131 family protein n=1 Tax=Methylocystis sp. (strain SC2) TaxID=187303 RepID=UPI00027AEF3C|nr:DUF5131 family protein [Methylocystis sp. SC2]CCJ07042.1 Phage Gp37/Gp68 family protein [Methylocystis sp. SC2]
MTKIEWASLGLPKGVTWNPIRARNVMTGKRGWHCEKVSPACEHCYAEALNVKAGDTGGTGLPYKPGHRQRGDVEIFLDEKTLLQPLSWRAPRGVFVCSMSDIFGDWVKDEWLDRIFAVMALCPKHRFALLTKRPKRMRSYLQSSVECFHASGQWREDMEALAGELTGSPCAAGLFEDCDWPLPNVWLGVTAEDQPRADERIPDLLATPAAMRFVSIEPMLGAIDMSPYIRATRRSERDWADFDWPSWVPEIVQKQVMDFWRKDWNRGPSAWLRSSIENGHPPLGTIGKYHVVRNGEPLVEGRFVHAWNNIGRVIDEAGNVHCVSAGQWQTPNPYIDWVICGGESGPAARPMHPAWARSLRDQCSAAEVPFFFKQWGRWEIAEELGDREEGTNFWRFPDGDEFRIVSDGHDIVLCAAEEGREPCKIWRDYWADGHGHLAKTGKAGRLLDGKEYSEFPEAR